MKKRHFFLPILAAFALSGCSLSDLLGTSNSSTSGDNNVSVDESLDTTEEGSVEHAGDAYDFNDFIEIESPEEIVVTETDAEFQITAEGDAPAFTQEEGLVTITSAGTYTLSGKFEGQILVNAKDQEVGLDLNGVSISYDKDSPIKILKAEKVEISAKKDTENIVKDLRDHKVEDDENQFEGAIAAKADLELKGKGKLVVEGNYNNGVHSTKDVKIKNLTLKVTGYNNAIKGKDSVTIESGTIQAYAQTGNGIKTENTDVSSKGNQRGNITIESGNVYVDSLHDGLDASYNVIVSEEDAASPTVLVVKCGKNATVYSSSLFVADSEKGLKAANEILISGGTISISASDDAIHANYGDTFDNSETGKGDITISGGLIKIASGDDGLHADNGLNIKGGQIYVTGAKEGLEATQITIEGGSTYVYGTDDGVNASLKSTGTPSFNMKGGYLDVAISEGDTDGIDSNGTVLIEGGVIITRGAPGTGSNMATGLDVDGSCTMTGGTLVSFNGLEKAPTVSSGVLFAGTSGSNSGNGMGGVPGGFRAGHGGGGSGGPGGGAPGAPGGGGSSSTSSYNFQAGKYTLSGTDIEISFTNDYSYSKFCVYSTSLVSGATYTLSRGESSVVSWTQSSSSVTIS